MTLNAYASGSVAHASFDESGSPIQLTYERTAYCGVSCTWLEFDQERSVHGEVLRQSDASSTQEYKYDTVDRLVGDEVEYDNLGRITDLPANTRVGPNWKRATTSMI